LNGKYENNLRANLNRLAIIAGILLLLKLFTYAVDEFLPVFSRVLSQVFSAFLPFILALLIAFLIEPVVQKLSKVLKIKRTYASFFVILFIAFLFIFLIVLLGSRLYKELAELTAAFPDIYNKTLTLLTEQVGILQRYVALNPEIQNAIHSSSQDIIGTLQFLVKKVSMGLLAFLGSLPGLMVVIVVTIVATLLTSISFPAVKSWLAGRVKGRYHSTTKLIVTNLSSALVGFLIAEIILMAITIVITTIGLFILGNQYAFTIGILSGLFNLIPVVGSALIFIPWVIVLFISGAIAQAIKILAVYLLATIIRQVLEPKILAQGMGIHPLPTLLSIYVGVSLFGISGLIIGPAVVVAYETLRKARILG
jgi:sporulation integral membrane protein YtvI